MEGEHWGCDIPSPHLIHKILWREWVVISYNQEKKMVGLGHLQKLWHKKILKRRKQENQKKKQMIREHWRWGIPSPNLIWWWIATTRSRRWWDTYRSCGRNRIKKQKQNRKFHKKKGKTRKSTTKKGGPWVPGRGGSQNIGSRAFLILNACHGGFWLLKIK